MALIPVCGLIITGFVIPYLKVSIGSKQLVYISQWVKKAVEAAAAGKTGSMVSIVADRTDGFKFSLDLVPLCDVANVEKKFPLEWIEGTNKISDEFFKYCDPLMGSHPDFAIFR